MNESLKMYIPERVRRILRQEAYFGCAECGDPILEYHHIIPRNEKKHNEPAHMIALCPTHHRKLGKLDRKRCYDLKAEPHNKAVGKLRGELGTNKKVTSFLVGSNTYEDTPIIFSYFETPIICYKIEDHQALLDIYIPKGDMWPDVQIKRNDMIVNFKDMWDVEFRTNYLKITKKKGEAYLEVDMRKEIALINGVFQINGREFRFSPKATNFGGANVSNCRFFRNRAGISVGDGRHRLLWPNFAMASPQAVFAGL